MVVACSLLPPMNVSFENWQKKLVNWKNKEFFERKSHLSNCSMHDQQFFSFKFWLLSVIGFSMYRMPYDITIALCWLAISQVIPFIIFVHNSMITWVYFTRSLYIRLHHPFLLHNSNNRFSVHLNCVIYDLGVLYKKEEEEIWQVSVEKLVAL